MSKSKFAVTRRDVLAGIGAGACALTVAPRLALADKAAADALIAKMSGGAAATAGKVKVSLPQIAENGNTVPFTVEVDHKQSADAYVKTIVVVAEGNPSPDVAVFHLSPASAPKVAMRMRLGKTQDVRAVAVLSNGTAYEGKQEVKVTIGGCGG